MKSPESAIRTIKNNQNRIVWIDALKAFAIIGIILNHFVEAYGPTAWFTNPYRDFPNFLTGLHNFFPHSSSFLISLTDFAGWLGDSGPGVFILLSGFTLMLGTLKRGIHNFSVKDFYIKRLIRILPLYILIHLITLGIYIIINHSGTEISPRSILLSLLGLRFTDHLFFYMNPSWWFIWLILQLYIIFPVLIWLYDKVGIKRFLLITILFTFFSRFLGLIHLNYNHSLYFWMTGLFFGTRLAEFTVGMGFAYWYIQSDGTLLSSLSETKNWIYSLLIYSVGLLCSIWYPATIFSNLLVTIGLSWILLNVWNILTNVKSFRFLYKPIFLIGTLSFPIFLLHQAPLLWTRNLVDNKLISIIISIVILAISFPSAWLLDTIVNKVSYQLKKGYGIKINAIYLVILSFIIITLQFYFLPESQNQQYNVLIFLILSLNVGLVFLSYFTLMRKNSFQKGLPYIISMISILVLLILPKRMNFIVLYLLLLYVPLFYFFSRNRAFNKSFAISGVVFTFICLALELILMKFHPLETLKWGEFEALQRHPTRIYSLKPNKTTHLKYNNYDYVLHTNSYGLAQPELKLNFSDSTEYRILVIGDAFTMPEGVKYTKSYPFLLEKELKLKYPHNSIRIINGGVTGYGPIEELSEINELGRQFHPSLIIYQFFINEFEEVNLTPESRLKNIGFMTNSDHGFKSKLTKILPGSQLIAHFDALNNYVSQFIKKEANPWRYWKSLLCYYSKETADSFYTIETINKVRSYLDKMKNTAEQLNAHFIVCYVPGAAEISDKKNIKYFPRNENLNDKKKYNIHIPYEKMSVICDSLDIVLINLTDALKNYPRQPVYFRNSWHWNKDGHKAVADTLVKVIKNYQYINISND